MDLRFRMLVCATLVATCLVEGVQGTCGELMPGLDQMVRGVDVTALDLIPQDISDKNGFKQKLLKTSCNNNARKVVAGKTYSVPDQVVHQSQLPSGSLTSNRHVIKTSSEMRKSMSANAGLGGIFKMFSFSASATYTKTQRKLTRNEKTVQSLSAQFNSKRVDLQPVEELQLDYYAKRMVDELPVTFSGSSRSQYETFIGKYGTHYVATATFGGVLNMYMETNTAYSETETTSKVEANAEATFMKVLSLKGGVTTSTSQIDKLFTSHTSDRMSYFGGSANLVKEGGIAEWQPTIEKKPWLYSAEVKPISDLITNPVRKIAMTKALEDYVMRTYLSVELPRMLNMIPSYYQRRNELTRIKDRRAQMVGQSVLVASQVEALRNDAEKVFAELMVTSSIDSPAAAPHQRNPVNGLKEKMMCPPGMIVSWLSLAGGVFRGKCVYPKGFPRLSCTKSTIISPTGRSRDVFYKCPLNSALKGIEWEDNFRFTCCEGTGGDIMRIENSPSSASRPFSWERWHSDTGVASPRLQVVCAMTRYIAGWGPLFWGASYCKYE